MAGGGSRRRAAGGLGPGAVIVRLHVCSSADAVGVRADLERLLVELDPTKPPKPANLDALLDDPSARLLLARDDDGACIGMLTLTFRNSVTRRSAHIDHVVVDPAQRRGGIGRLLVEEALRLAAAEGATRVDLTSSPRRVGAQAFYASLGFEQRSTQHWRRPL